MAAEYSISLCREFEKKFHQLHLYRPMRISRYDDGTRLSYDVTYVTQRDIIEGGRVHLVVEQFAGSGFAGQVYRVRIVKIEGVSIEALYENNVYAMKILVPSSSFSLFFRNLIYAIGFQSSFQPQTNPEAARAGAIWQKFIRRAAMVTIGDEKAVNDIHAIFIDPNLGSCGELSDWVEGRNWRLEVDDRMDLLRRWQKGKNVDSTQLGSPEYRAKKKFMDDFVKLLHEMGAHEFARQYEWSTWKSQPNCLKRRETENNPMGGLTAVDFRAGLALLPFLPMSPGDVKLIIKGIMRGSLVQFDRGDINRLDAYIHANGNRFSDMHVMMRELRSAEKVYRNSMPDITHNHIRLLYSKRLWSTMIRSSITGWKVRNIIDNDGEAALRKSTLKTLLFMVLGIIPVLGTLLQRMWAHKAWRTHYLKLLSSSSYIRSAIKGKILENVALWYRTGRIDNARAGSILDSLSSFLLHWLISFLPVGMHKFLTNWQFARERLVYIFVRPVRLYFNRELREQWLRDMVKEGQAKHIITEEDANTILSQIHEPFIQKYLKSLAVHVCTLPVTQIVSVTIAVIYVLMHPEMPGAQAWGIGLGIIALFQVTPVSPGSLVRGLYVVYLVIRERDFKNYNIAVFLGFFKYIGYLAFPIQMTYRYPALARFMAVHWATDAVHIIPVFGESGALLEHSIFCLFYNWPLTIRRGMHRKAEIRAAVKPRYWHAGIYVLAGAGALAFADYVLMEHTAHLIGLKNILWLIFVPFFCGAGVTLGCGGAVLSKRILTAALCGITTGIVYTVLSAITMSSARVDAANIVVDCVWRVFVFAILSTVGAVITELRLPGSEMM